ncbi:MAG: 4-alpha-glucanotransferase, partial [Chloroflexota bacterium]
AAISSPRFQQELAGWRNSPAVDYHGQAAARRRILEELSRCCFAGSSARIRELQEFARANPAVEDYARFRAAGEKQRACWQDWPEPARTGKLGQEDYDEGARRYHLYVQWLAHEQMEALSTRLRDRGLRMYLDFPLGVHPGGYDVWRNQDVFVPGASVGAPPDTVFTAGQDWSLPPLHPEKLRQQGYAHYIACLRHHLQHAGILRIDHVMGLHRLFWIPKGLDCRDGVYVRYPADEFYAILSLESWRNRAWIVGENLGTVPSHINPTLARHGIHGMYVLQYQFAADARRPIPTIPERSVASLNTHDTPTFAGFWEGLDIKDRLQLGLLENVAAGAERLTRRAMRKALVAYLKHYGWLDSDPADAGQLARACLSVLSASAARLVLVNLEDLWQEEQPQNVPGTDKERPNWQRKARFGLETFCQMPSVRDTLHEMDFLRRQRKRRP